MANWRAFSQGFTSGQQIGNAYLAAKERQELEDISKAKPEDVNGYTEGDGQHLRNIAEAKDADGNAAYQLEARPDGGYGIKTRQADGSYALAEGPGIAPQRRSDFLGTRYDTAPDPTKQDRLRYSAMADVVSRRDPAAGLRMRREVASQERDDARFDMEQQRAGRERKQWEQDDAMRQSLSDFMNKRLTDPTTGQQRVPTDDDLMAGTQHIAISHYRNGNTEKAIEYLGKYGDSVMKKIQRETVERDNAMGPALLAAQQGDSRLLREFYNKYIPDGAQVVDIKIGPKGDVTIMRQLPDGTNLPPKQFGSMLDITKGLIAMKDPAAVYKFSMDEMAHNLQLQRLGLQERELGMRGAALQLERDKAARPQAQNLREFTDAKGNAVMVDVTNLPRGEGGVIQMPPGLRPRQQRPEVTTKDVLSYAEGLLGETDPTTQKPFTRERALAEARRQLSGQQDPFAAKLDAVLSGGEGDPFAPAAPKGKPSAGGLKTPTPEGQQLLGVGRDMGWTKPPERQPMTSRERERQLRGLP